MDPNIALEELRELFAGKATAEAAAFQDLDEWLSKGGFLPDDWNVLRFKVED
jgi:hypothetical protein